MQKYEPLTRSKRALFSAVLVVGLVLLGELFGLVAVLIREGEPVFWSGWQERRQTVIQQFDRQDRIEAAQGMRIPMGGDVLHPYLGAVGDPSARPSVNPFGFYGERPIRQRSPSRIIVGVTGGSVAQGFATMGMPTVERVLKQAGRFRDKEFVVVNLARGGYKQPQPLMALNYMLTLGAEFDIVINIDGFNDVALHEVENALQNVFPAFPRVWFMLVDPVPDPGLLRAIGRSEYLRAEMVTLARAQSHGALRLSTIANLLWDFRQRRMAGQYVVAQRRIDSLTKQAEQRTYTMMHKYRPGSTEVKPAANSEPPPYWVTGPRIEFDGPKERFAFQAAVWKQSSIQLHRLCQANDILYLHLLQPNQYVAGSKPMGRAERSRAYNPDQPYKPGAEQGYPLLIDAGRELARTGVWFLDLTGIFSTVEQPVYIDDCCHYNIEGYQLIGRRVAGEILDRYGDR